jgi:UDPglucose 6-dehydrogenase
MNVCVIGTGYVGLVTGVCLAHVGHDVRCVDRDSSKIALLERGRSPIYEPHLDDLLALVQASGNLQFTLDLHAGLHDADVVIIAVGTPPLPSGEPDLSAVEQVALSIGEAIAARPDAPLRIIVNKSTVPIGSGNWVEALVDEGGARLLARVGGRSDDRPRGGTGPLTGRFIVASNPEFLREGSAIADTFYADRIVLGASDPRAIAALREMYAPILEQTFTPPTFLPRPDQLTGVPLVTTDLQSAELIKYAANAFLATKISFINEMSSLCEKVGGDILEVARGIGLDPRIGHRFLQAGAGWGGSCFGKDLSALMATQREYHLEPRILEAAVAVNRAQRDRIVTKLQEGLKVLKGRTIGVLGLAFKPGTDDLRDAPALDIARSLVRLGARVRVHDPVAMARCRQQHPDLDVVYADDPVDLAAGTDALVLVTEWEAYRVLDWRELTAVSRGRLVVDARNALDRERVVAAGWNWVGVGR